MPQCPLHHKDYQAFCFDDNSILCIDCLLVSKQHYSHEVSTLEMAVKFLKTSIKDNLEALRAAVANYPTLTGKTSTFNAHMITLKSKIIEQIQNFKQQFLQAADEYFENSLANVHHIFECQFENLSSLGRQNEKMLQQAEKMIKQMQEQIEKPVSDFDLIESFRSLNVCTAFKRSPLEHTPAHPDLFHGLNSEDNRDALKAKIGKCVHNGFVDMNRIQVAALKDLLRVFSEHGSLIGLDSLDLLDEFSFPNKTAKINFTRNLSEMKLNYLSEEANSQNASKISRAEEVSDARKLKITESRVSEVLQNINTGETSTVYVNSIRPASNKNKPSHFSSLRVIDSKNFSKSSDSVSGNFLKKTQANQLYLISGGSKSASFYLRILNLQAKTIMRKKMPVEQLEKNGTYVNGKDIYLFGGKVKGKASDRVFACSYNKCKVEDLAPFRLKSKKYDFAYLELKPNIVLLVGGQNEKGVKVDEIELVDFEKKETRVIGRLLQGKSNMAVVKITNPLNGMQAINGPIANVLSPCHPQLDGFDPDNIEFTRLEEQKSISFDITIMEDQNDKFNYSFEEESSKKESSINFSQDKIVIKDFNDDTNSIFEKSPEPRIKHGFDFAQSQDFIFIIGGEDQSGKILKSVDCFNPESSLCFEYSALLQPRKDAWAFSVDQSAWVIGGEGPKCKLKCIEKIERETCVKTGNIYSERCGFKGIVRDRQVMLFGGRGNKGVLNTIEHLAVDNGKIKLVKRTPDFEHLAYYELCKYDL